MVQRGGSMITIHIIMLVLMVLVTIAMFVTLHRLSYSLMLSKFFIDAYELLGRVLILDLKRGIDPNWRMEEFLKMTEHLEKDKWGLFRMNPAKMIRKYDCFNPSVLAPKDAKVVSMYKWGDVELKEGDKVKVKVKGGERMRKGVVEVNDVIGFVIRTGKKKIAMMDNVEKLEVMKGRSK